MDFWTIVIALYCLTTLIAVSLTYQEQKQRQEGTPIYTAIGYLLCTVWPVVAAVMVVVYRPGHVVAVRQG